MKQTVGMPLGRAPNAVCFEFLWGMAFCEAGLNDVTNFNPVTNLNLERPRKRHRYYISLGR